MGSYGSLSVGDFEIESFKNYLTFPVDFFIPSDRKHIPASGEEEIDQYFYSAPVCVVIQRIQVMGYSLDEVIQGQKKYTQALISFYEDHELNLENRDEALKVLTAFDFDRWCAVIKRIMRKDVKELEYGVYSYEITEDIDVLNSSAKDDGYFGTYASMKSVILALLNLVEDKINTQVTLHYGDLVAGGWIKPEEDLCRVDLTEKVVILTEGQTDRKYIELSLKYLRPNLFPYFSFLDFGELKLSGSASSLVHTIKALAAAGIQNTIVAVFDNDAAAESAMKPLVGLPLKENFRVIKLPNLEFLSSYPTIGPQGAAFVDVNGRAGSIELYFEKSVLIGPKGHLIPVVWKGYEEGAKKYQGEIMDKNLVQKKFEAVFKKIEQGADMTQFNFNSMNAVLDLICESAGLKIKGI